MDYDSLLIVPNKASSGASRNHGTPFSIIVTILPVCCLSFLSSVLPRRSFATMLPVFVSLLYCRSEIATLSI